MQNYSAWDNIDLNVEGRGSQVLRIGYACKTNAGELHPIHRSKFGVRHSSIVFTSAYVSCYLNTLSSFNFASYSKRPISLNKAADFCKR